MNLTSYAIAFVVGLAVTLWLAARQAAPRAARWLRWLAAGAGAVALTAAGAAGWQAVRSGAASAFEAQPAAPEVWTNARLLIPDLGLDEKIRRVPIRDDRWDLSQLDHAVGLLAGAGLHPHDDLAMVLTGHVSLPPSVPGPFAELSTLPPVRKIIYRVGGTDYSYAITESIGIAPGDVDQLIVRDGSQLLLVTCTDWNYLTETYNQRLLVKAVLFAEHPAETAAVP